ncbi:KAP family NTPase [Shewanella xiamenensis]|uniref:KAP family NTPase n=1 Tax=Shewanella xiamenensis TaxID=332186 RepID=UPI001F06B64B|nr:KAP family NTPase [Shewanella xiamenensis]UML92127.1 KAP family NTPase [Shewanella xiamenensis]
MSHSVLCKQICENLKDASFPPIVLLQGPWGSGKTYFAKNILKDELIKEHPLNGKCLYISLYGITSLDDFRDKLLSLFFFNGKSSLSYVTAIKDIIGNISKFKGDKGAVLGSINALSKPIKHSLLSKLTNVTLIVDDLERIHDDKLISEILGECYNLAENNSNLWVVVIANREKINKNDLLEKTFAHHVTCSASPNDLINFFKSFFNNSNLPEETSDHLHATIINLEITNYRVIKRIANRFIPLIGFTEQEKIDTVKAQTMLIDQIAKICNAHYCHNFSIKEILSIKESKTDFSLFLNIKDDEKNDVSPEKLKEIKLQNLLLSNFGKIQPILVEYCLNMSPSNIISINTLSLPLSSHVNNESDILDILMHGDIGSLSYTQFSKGLTPLKSLIFDINDKNIGFHKWLKAVDSYSLLLTKNYIPGNINDFTIEIESLAKSKVYIVDGTSSYNHYTYYSDVANKIVNELNSTYQSNLNKVLNQDLINRLYTSWSNVRNEVYEKHINKSFLASINVNDLLLRIMNNWSYNDTVSFGQFLSTRYNSVNLSNPLDKEFPIIENLSSMLEDKLKNMTASFEKGKITEFNLLIKKTIQDIDTSKTYLKRYTTDNNDK